MKLIIFGSTGGTGRQVVGQALEQGHDVTAFVRSPEKLDQKHEKLHPYVPIVNALLPGWK